MDGSGYPALAEHEAADVVAAHRQRGEDRAAAEEDIDENNISKNYIYLFLLLLVSLAAQIPRGYLVDRWRGLSALENNTMICKKISIRRAFF